MNILKIRIEKDRFGSLFAYNKARRLFQFEYRKKEKRWLFWIRGEKDPEAIAQKKFPLDFFKDACRAVDFIQTGGPLTDDTEISEGMDLVG